MLFLSQTYLEFSRRGARVLALAYREFGTLDAQAARELKREDVEKDLIFAGFLIISCPLKADSKGAIKEIVKSSHKVVMITGDNPLTACHVAKELRFTRKTVLVLNKDIQSIDEDLKPKYLWVSINQDQVEAIDEKNWKNLVSKYDLAITGDGLEYLNDYKYKYFRSIAPYISVYARFAPKQKEYIITTLKSLGEFKQMKKYAVPSIAKKNQFSLVRLLHIDVWRWNKRCWCIETCKCWRVHIKQRSICSKEETAT